MTVWDDDPLSPSAERIGDHVRHGHSVSSAVYEDGTIIFGIGTTAADLVSPEDEITDRRKSRAIQGSVLDMEGLYMLLSQDDTTVGRYVEHYGATFLSRDSGWADWKLVTPNTRDYLLNFTNSHLSEAVTEARQRLAYER